MAVICNVTIFMLSAEDVHFDFVPTEFQSNLFTLICSVGSLQCTRCSLPIGIVFVCISCTIFVTQCAIHLNIPWCVETLIAHICRSEFHTMISIISSYDVKFRVSFEFA